MNKVLALESLPDQQTDNYCTTGVLGPMTEKSEVSKS